MKRAVEKGMFGGFIVATLTVAWHIIHCALPFIIPLLIALNLPTPHFLHHLQIPFAITVMSAIWMIYFLLRKRIIIFFPNFPKPFAKKQCH